MSLERLRQLRKKADLILSPSNLGEVPKINKSLSQLEKEYKSMSEKIPSTHELNAKAHYFLASNGIDIDHVSTPIDTSRTFEITPLENHTDINKFLLEEHERILIDTVETQRRENHEALETFFEENFESFVFSKNRERIEEDEGRADLKAENLAGVTRIKDYAAVTTSLNEMRKINTDVDLIPQLSKVKNYSFVQKWQDAAIESWNILQHLVKKSVPTESKLESRFLSLYTTQPNQSVTATDTRRLLINASRTWLEQQAAQYVNDQVNKNATKIRVGGIPSISHRLLAFINLVFKNVNGWIDHRLEIVDELPIWAYVYLLIRIGHMDVAYKYVDNYREKFAASEGRFFDYFNNYMNSENHSLSDDNQKAILEDYQRLAYGGVNADPYKIALYKIFGRCELDNRGSPEVIQSTEDYLWLQFMLVREVTDAEKFPYTRHRLEDVQNYISELGSQYFDRDENNVNPWIYFKILLLTHQFEKAVDHLHREKKLRLETVHFATALVYYGLVRLTLPPMTKSKNMLIEHEGHDTLNYPHLVYQYVQVYLPDLPTEALQYLSLVSLYSPKQGYPNNEYVDLAKQYICKFTISSKNFKTLLGSRSNETRTPGLLDSIKDIIYISSETDYANQVIDPIAKECVQKGRRMDAVYAYSISGQFNKMVNALKREISDALQQPQSYRATNPTLSELTNQEILTFALDTMQQYESNQYMSNLIDAPQKNTVRILIQLLQFRIAYENGQYDQALQIINQCNIIPLEGDTSTVQIYSSQFQQCDESIQKNIPELVLNVMDIVYKIWASYVDNLSIPATELRRLEAQAQTILLFASLIEYYIPGDIIVRLNKVDRLMSLKRQR